jgi:hypothetical protein
MLVGKVMAGQQQHPRLHMKTLELQMSRLRFFWLIWVLQWRSTTTPFVHGKQQVIERELSLNQRVIQLDQWLQTTMLRRLRAGWMMKVPCP